MNTPQINQSLKSLLTELKNDGVPTERIVAIAQQISSASAAKFYEELSAALSKEEIAEINTKTNSEEAEVLIKAKFKESTGKEAEEVKDEIISDLANAFHREYSSKKG